MSTTIHLLLLDTHTLFRAGLRLLLAEHGDLEVVAETDSGTEAISLVSRTRPDIVLLEAKLPDLDGLFVARMLGQMYPQVRCVFLSGEGAAAQLHEAVAAGAAGYLLKSATPDELVQAVYAVARGETYFSPALLDKAGDQTDPAGDIPAVNDPAAARKLWDLSPRQRQVLQRLAQGETTREIAAALGISPKTVETHRLRLMARLGIYDVPGLVRYALRAGLIESD